MNTTPATKNLLEEILGESYARFSGLDEDSRISFNKSDAGVTATCMNGDQRVDVTLDVFGYFEKRLEACGVPEEKLAKELERFIHHLFIAVPEESCAFKDLPAVFDYTARLSADAAINEKFNRRVNGAIVTTALVGAAAFSMQHNHKASDSPPPQPITQAASATNASPDIGYKAPKDIHWVGMVESAQSIKAPAKGK